VDTGIARTRIGRRGFLRGAALGGVGLATAAVIGCASDDEEEAPAAAAPAAAKPSAKATPAAKSAGTTKKPAAKAAPVAKTASLNHGRQNKSPSMDPNTTALAPAEYYAVYDPLTRLDATGNKVEPALAESWEPKGRDWIFKLREAEWSDGTPFTASDVKFSFEYYSNADNKSRLISRVNTQDSVIVVDDRTVRIRATGTDPIMPRRAALPYIIPKHIYDGIGTSTGFSESLARNPVGTGSYVAKKIVQDQSIEFAASPSSWRGNQGFTNPKLNFIEEYTTLVAALETRDVDYMNRVPATEVARVRKFPNIQSGAAASLGSQHWDFNNRNAEANATNDVRVRRALINAIDAPLIIDAVYRTLGTVATDQMPSSSVFGFSPEKTAIPYDPDKGRQLLKDAGFANGFDMRVDSRLAGDAKAEVEATTGFWQDLGIKTSINVLEINVWRDRLYGREQAQWPGAFNAGWIAYLYDCAFLYDWYEGDGAYRLWDGADDPTAKRFDEIYGAALVELDEEKREGLYRQINDLFAYDGEAPVGPTRYGQNIDAWGGDLINNPGARSFPELVYDELIPA
jgi:peptide/nickel transport system substrate-binding protein